MCTTYVIVSVADWAEYAGDPEYRTASEQEASEVLESMGKKYPEAYRKVDGCLMHSDGTDVLIVFAKDEVN